MGSFPWSLGLGPWSLALGPLVVGHWSLVDPLVQPLVHWSNPIGPRWSGWSHTRWSSLGHLLLSPLATCLLGPSRWSWAQHIGPVLRAPPWLALTVALGSAHFNTPTQAERAFHLTTCLLVVKPLQGFAPMASAVVQTVQGQLPRSLGFQGRCSHGVHCRCRAATPKPLVWWPLQGQRSHGISCRSGQRFPGPEVGLDFTRSRRCPRSPWRASSCPCAAASCGPRCQSPRRCCCSWCHRHPCSSGSCAGCGRSCRTPST